MIRRFSLRLIRLAQITWLPAATVIYHHAFEEAPACCCQVKLCLQPPKVNAWAYHSKPHHNDTVMHTLYAYYTIRL